MKLSMSEVEKIFLILLVCCVLVAMMFLTRSMVHQQREKETTRSQPTFLFLQDGCAVYEFHNSGYINLLVTSKTVDGVNCFITK